MINETQSGESLSFMLRRVGYILVVLLVLAAGMPLYGFRIVSYNVENLFDCNADSLHQDNEFTPEGARNWTYARYNHKREQIARTLTHIGGWEGVAIAGLCEVENEQCVHDLCRYNLRNMPYSYIHYDSPDVRGIDVALLYRTDMFSVLYSEPIHVPIADGERPTRDILYVSGRMPNGDTLYVYMCHLPSQLGGASHAAALRLRAKQTMQVHIDSIRNLHPEARIVVMGDMNSEPEQDISGMHNLMLSMQRCGQGSYKHQGIWSCIDQFYVSENIADSVLAHICSEPWLLTDDDQYVGYKPFRTYVGYQYNRDGYSDHLPIVLDLPFSSPSTQMNMPLIGILEDIYSQITEETMDGEQTDFETLTEQLLALTEHPIPLNGSNYDALAELPFLSETQISNILLMARDIPFHSMYELQLVQGLKDYEVRNLLPFVQIGESPDNPVYPREMIAYGRHDISLRTDARNIEAFSGTDPVYVQAKYGYTYQRKVAAGLTIRRPVAGTWKDLQYGGYVQLNDIGVLKRLVGGCYQARFGQGLVTNHFFHTGKSSYVMLVGGGRQGFSKVSSAGSERYQGVGATLRVGKHTEASGWYSVDSTKVWHHAIGANVNANFRQLRVGVTIMEHIYSDSLPVANTYYNHGYFRGKNQCVLGFDIRYSFRWMQLFAEVAAAENTQWGMGCIAGLRVMPMQDLGIIALYRYYSPTFDNVYGYAFSEGSRLGDEQGGYIGVEYKGLRHWRMAAYGDVFYFEGAKFGIRQPRTMGYEVLGQAEYTDGCHSALLSWRSRHKGDMRTHRARAEYTYTLANWRWHTRADLSLGKQIGGYDPGYGLSLCQDIEYRVSAIPMVIQLRLQGFDVPQWDNRIYTYENDVLYAFSIPATYGVGGRCYANMRYRLTEQLSLYFRISETIYTASWAASKSRPITRTDIHLLLRANL